jgi:hypothetical protein
MGHSIGFDDTAKTVCRRCNKDVVAVAGIAEWKEWSQGFTLGINQPMVVRSLVERAMLNATPVWGNVGGTAISGDDKIGVICGGESVQSTGLIAMGMT